jgi:1,2-diacylglycerol 3-alpha-glucosyltransferase
MKILITTEFYFPIVTGVATVVKNQFDMLRSMGHDARILVVGPGRKTCFEDDIYHIKASRIRFYPDSYATFRFHDPMVRDVIAWKPDVVHSNGEFFSMVFARRVSEACRCPLVHTCHTDFSTYGKNYMKSQRLWEAIISRVVRARLKTVDRVIVPSAKTRDMLLRYKVGKPLEVIPSGIDVDRFALPFRTEERDALRKRFGLEPDHVVFVSICRLAPEKNVAETVDRFSEVASRLPAARLLVVGGGPDRKTLESQVGTLGLKSKVLFAGPVDPSEVWKYFRIGDVFVSSSVSETQGLTYVEALAAGLPLLCRRDKSLEYSLVEGVNGFGFDDGPEFCDRAVALATDGALRRRLHQAALEHAQRFGREAWATRLLSLYDACRRR